MTTISKDTLARLPTWLALIPRNRIYSIIDVTMMMIIIVVMLHFIKLVVESCPILFLFRLQKIRFDPALPVQPAACDDGDGDGGPSSPLALAPGLARQPTEV